MKRKTHNTEKPRRRLLPLFIVVVIVALTVWQWPVIHKEYVKGQQAIKTYLADVDALGQKRRALMTEVAATQQTAKERLGQYEAKLTQSQKIQQAFNDVSKDSQPDTTSFALEEIEQQVIVANLHLGLGGNVKAAIEALNKALSLVQQTENEELSSLEDNLSNNIESLAASSSVDTSAIIMQLDNFTSSVDTLPLMAETNLADVDIEIIPKPTPMNNDSWFKFIDEIWQDAKAFINVQKVSNPEIQVLSPSQNYFLQENLKLKFLLMRFSLLSGNQDNFNADLQAAISWIKQYYDQESAPVISLLQALMRLQETDTGFELPDISTNLDKIHNYRIKRNEENK